MPLFFAAHGLGLAEIGVLVAVYPAVWGVAQIGTGALSDRIGRKGLIVAGMLLQAVALGLIAASSSFGPWLVEAALLGLGTAMVYPTLLAAVADVAAPVWRGAAIGVYRLWRDLGFAIGAVLAGFVADRARDPVRDRRSSPRSPRPPGCSSLVRMRETRLVQSADAAGCPTR